MAARLTDADATSIQELDAGGARLKLLAWRGLHREAAAFWAWVQADDGNRAVARWQAAGA